MPSPDLDQMADSVILTVKAAVRSALSGVIARIAVLESRGTPRDGRDGEPGASVDQKDVEAMVAVHVATAIAAMDVAPMVQTEVEKAVAALPAPKDGKDVDTAIVDIMVAAQVERAVAALPRAKDGQSVTVDDVAPLIVAEVQKAVTALPPPKDGQSVDPGEVDALIVATVEKAVAALPPAKDGRDGQNVDPVEVESLITEKVQKAVAALPVPKDGHSVTLDEVAQMIQSLVEKAFSTIRVPNDGLGIKSTVVDRAGHLVFTMTDGTEKDLGSIVGQDGKPGLPGVPGRTGEKGADARDGVDGLGFDDIVVEHDGERTFTIKFKRGDRVKVIGAFTIPVEIYRGVYVDGKTYERGDGATWGGSEWHANETTSTKPGDGSKAWTLKVKRGRDGKDGKDSSTSATPFPVVSVGKR